MRLYAIDVGGSHIACALVEDGRIAVRADLAVNGCASFTAMLTAIERALLGFGAKGVAGLAIAFPALVDPVACRVLATPKGKYEDAVGIDFKAWSRAALGVPARIELDGRMALLGERHAGALRGENDAVLLSLGTGIGTAAMMEGRLLRGRHAQAGVLGGHVSIDAHGAPCICGGVGCIEAEASTWALPRLIARFDDDALAKLDRPDFASVFGFARGGDATAIAVRDHCLAMWSVAAINLVHAYDPAVVLLTGGLMAATEDILAAIRAHVHAHAWTPWGKPEIRVGTLGTNAALLGAEPLWTMA